MNKHILFTTLFATAILAAACSTEETSDDDEGSECAQACEKLDGCGMCVATEGQCLTVSDCTSGCESNGGTSMAQCVNNVSGCNEGALNACFGSGGSCDTGTYGAIDSALCDACFSCATNGACAGTVSTCQNSSDCQAFLGCYDGCADNACLENCYSQYPTGGQQFLDYLSCGICVECPNNCDAASNCS